MLNKHRLRLLVRYFASECTEKERHEVESWVKANHKNAEIFDGFRTIWQLSGESPEKRASRRAITEFRLKLKDADSSQGGHEEHKFKLYRIIPRRKPGRLFSPAIITQIAAVMIILAGTFYVVNYVKKMASQERQPAPTPAIRYEEVSTKTGEQATLRFSDGTKVVLNSASRLRYADHPDGSLQFHLDGEAYFEVVHSEFRPLVVKTAHAVIRDIGTKFDVKAWPDGNQTEVTVAEGEVVVRPQNRPPSDNAIVAHGQYTAVRNDGTLLAPTYANVERTIAWINGKLVFYNEPMINVIKQLKRKYGLQCFVADHSVLSKTITATFENGESTKEILDIIALSLKLKYRTSNDSVLFVPTKPHPMWEKTNQEEEKL